MLKEELREKLHEYIASADLQEVKAIYKVLEEKIERADDLKAAALEYVLSTEQLKEVEKRRKEYLAGKSKIHKWKDAKKLIAKRI